jgi:hypothetical protein
MARLYREAPLNRIWEGTGNVISLDVLRSMQREPNCSISDEFAPLFRSLDSAAMAKRHPRGTAFGLLRGRLRHRRLGWYSW